MEAQHEISADYQAAFEEGAQANERGELSPVNPYDDTGGPLRAGWRDGFASAQKARDEWEGDLQWRARNFGEAA
jgi:hypothetical protein